MARPKTILTNVKEMSIEAILLEENFLEEKCEVYNITRKVHPLLVRLNALKEELKLRDHEQVAKAHMEMESLGF